MQDWQKDIQVDTRDDGYHLSLTSQTVRSKLADAIRDGSTPLVLGQGNKRCVIEFGGSDTAAAQSNAGFR